MIKTFINPEILLRVQCDSFLHLVKVHNKYPLHKLAVKTRSVNCSYLNPLKFEWPMNRSSSDWQQVVPVTCRSACVLLCVCRARSGRAAAVEWGSATPSPPSFSSSTTSCRLRRVSWPAPNNWVGTNAECLCCCLTFNVAFVSSGIKAERCDILNIYRYMCVTLPSSFS